MTDPVENAAQPAAAAAPETAARGVTTVSEEVIEKIAVAAAREVAGVADLGGDVSRFFDSVLNKVGLDEVGDASRGASAEVKGTSVVINIVIVIEAGQVVADVTKAVQVKVIEAVEKYGLKVTQVNVKVDDIEMNNPAAGA
ncbi:MAG: Asp23/Gls24 family envelope stress response protein [Actinocatenispora sp.]